MFLPQLIALLVWLIVSLVTGGVSIGPTPYQLQGPCSDDGFDHCREAQYELQDLGSNYCDGEGRRVCLVPVGLVPSDLIIDLAAYYQETYDLDVRVMRPIGIPEYIVVRDREQPSYLPIPNFLQPFVQEPKLEEDHDQIGALTLADYMNMAFPDEASDPDAVLIGITPVDVFYEGASWRWAFGARYNYYDPKAMISVYRMDPRSYGKDADDELLLTRARKMTTKYIGLLYYGLAESADPTSPVYNRIHGVPALDNVTEPLRFDGGFANPPPTSPP